MDKKDIKLIIISSIIFILIITYMWLLSQNKVEEKNINLYEVSNINDSDDPQIRDVYHQYNPEDNILFNLIGSGIDNNYYAYYYKKDKTTYQELDNTIKTYLTIHSYDYKNSPINQSKNCYEVKIEDINITYEKLFNNNNFIIDNSINNPKIDINNENICIYEETTNSYNYTLDTLFVNAAYQDNELLIYEHVAFIKINNNDIEFYSDYEMKNLIYKAKRNELDTSFLNNTNIVSNILMKYQEKFNIYTYTFEKKGEHFIFKSINK